MVRKIKPYRYGVYVQVTSSERLALRQIRAAFTARQWYIEELGETPIATKAATFRLPRREVAGK